MIVIVFSWPGPGTKGHVSFCLHWVSVIFRPLLFAFHILIDSSETTGPIWTKICMDGASMVSFQNCIWQGFQSGPVPGTFTRLRSCIVPAEITEPPKISGGQNHKYDGR